jgi:hypothetical protein
VEVAAVRDVVLLQVGSGLAEEAEAVEASQAAMCRSCSLKIL